ncbi:MAG: hypothetical protein DI589_03760 [Shinella sp.]|nr:MAG: hypothetical protein DI589_03760 [Shinella sp.]
MRLQFLHHQRTAVALQEIRGRSGVEFECPGEGDVRRRKHARRKHRPRFSPELHIIRRPDFLDEERRSIA